MALTGHFQFQFIQILSNTKGGPAMFIFRKEGHWLNKLRNPESDSKAPQGRDWSLLNQVPIKNANIYRFEWN